MNISTLEQYVEQRNSFARIFGQKELSLLNAKDRQALANRLDADLSPENLTCDGEIRGAQLQAKSKFLNRAAAELAALDPNVVFGEFY